MTPVWLGAALAGLAAALAAVGAVLFAAARRERAIARTAALGGGDLAEHEHAWQVVGVEPHEPSDAMITAGREAGIAELSAWSVIKRHCGCGTLNSVVLPGRWTLAEARGEISEAAVTVWPGGSGSSGGGGGGRGGYAAGWPANDGGGASGSGSGGTPGGPR